ncbi:phage head spike fiber domain-containing protein [Paraburkholderia sp. J10-1]|uniref:phage head spike fiber domain-containing protein n=1 Tax=Paraburkholderia sp. J10-1 TaxID=2805430 RepID=UPI002AB6D5D3|nr:hypothetical protein [Paraburkholderia sp. J10-1]
MTSIVSLSEVAAPELAPLVESFEYDQLEAELKAIFLSVFESLIRPRERRLNLYGMPHLGDTELIERALKNAGLALVKRTDTRSSFLMKAMALNPRRGTIFLKQYLQSVWPNVWEVEQLWHPIASAARYPQDCKALVPLTLGGGITVEYDGEDAANPAIYQTGWQGKQRLYSTPRTNLLKNSGACDKWTWFDVAVKTDGTLAPDGKTLARLIVEDDVNYQHAVSQTVVMAIAPGEVFTHTTFLRPRERTVARVFLADGGTKAYCGVFVDLLTGNVVRTEQTGVWHLVSVQCDLLSDGWCQCRLTGYVEQGVEVRSTVYVTNGATSGYKGDGKSGFYHGGSQLERGAIATSYIATDAQQKTVTDYVLDAKGVATFPQGQTAPAVVGYFPTGRISVTLPVTSDNGMGLLEIGKAFRATLAARLMLELHLLLTFENIGASGGLALANGATGVMPFMATGTLKK